MLPKGIIFDVHIPPEGWNFDEMKAFCLHAEKLGFDMFTITDHFLSMALGRGVTAPHLIRHPLECWTTLAGLAAVTSKIRLGPLVSCYYFRLPTVLAKMATTVDIISNGRLVFGIGAGWHKMEFESFIGQFPPTKERLLGLEETIQICRSMFTQEVTSFKGKIYRFEGVINSPLPVQRPPPILIGGMGEKVTLRIAAKYADICHLMYTPNEKILEQKLNVLKMHCKKVGRDYEEIRKGIFLTPIIGYTREEIEHKLKIFAEQLGRTPEEHKNVIAVAEGTPDQCIHTIKRYIERGVTFFALLGFPTPRDLDLFANEVMQEIKRSY